MRPKRLFDLSFCIFSQSLVFIGFQNFCLSLSRSIFWVFAIVLGCSFPILFPIHTDPSLFGNPLFTGLSNVFRLFSALFFPILSQQPSFRPAVQIRRNLAKPCKYCVSCGSALLTRRVIASLFSGFRKASGGSSYAVSGFLFPTMCANSFQNLSNAFLHLSFMLFHVHGQSQLVPSQTSRSR